MTVHTHSDHDTEPKKKPAKRPAKTKPAAEPKEAKKKKIKNTQQLIYVMPGPVPGNPVQNALGQSAAENGLKIEHNYQVNPVPIDMEASKNPKFVFVVDLSDGNPIEVAENALQVYCSTY